jgi:disulfide bond formation protein DsbB
MRNRGLVYKKIFFAISSLATSFVLAEIIMQFFGKSLCRTEGCKVVAQHVRYGDLSILLIGLVTFSLLAILSFPYRSVNKKGLEPLINLILIVSLACEGFFTGYQAFAIHTPCVLCLIILGTMVILGILRLLAGETALIAGFLSLTAVFGMFYLVLPAQTTPALPEHDRLILFYSKECGHCAEIMKEFEENKMPVKHLEVNGYAAYLKSMGIEHVPTLFVNSQYQKIFITGTDAIRRYLFTCSEASKAAQKGNQDEISGNPKKLRQTDDLGMTPGIFSPLEILAQPGEPTPDAGICKEDEACKE